MENIPRIMIHMHKSRARGRVDEELLLGEGIHTSQKGEEAKKEKNPQGGVQRCHGERSEKASTAEYENKRVLRESKRGGYNKGAKFEKIMLGSVGR